MEKYQISEEYKSFISQLLQKNQKEKLKQEMEILLRIRSDLEFNMRDPLLLERNETDFLSEYGSISLQLAFIREKIRHDFYSSVG